MLIRIKKTEDGQTIMVLVEDGKGKIVYDDEFPIEDLTKGLNIIVE